MLLCEFGTVFVHRAFIMKRLVKSAIVAQTKDRITLFDILTENNYKINFKIGAYIVWVK